MIRKVLYIFLGIISFSLFSIIDVKAYVPDDYIFTDSGAKEWTINDVIFSKTDIEYEFENLLGYIPEDYFCLLNLSSNNIICPYYYDKTNSNTQFYINNQQCSDHSTCTYYPPETTTAIIRLMKSKRLVYRPLTGEHSLSDSTSSSTSTSYRVFNYGYGESSGGITAYRMLYTTYDIYTNYNGYVADNKNKEHLMFKATTFDYEFDEDLDDVGVKEFEFKFDTSYFNDQYSFDLDFIFSSVTGIYDNPDLPLNEFEFKGDPYLTFTMNGVNHVETFKYDDNSRKFVYEGDLAWNFKDIVSDLKLHFPVDETDNARYHITLNSNLPFVLTPILDEDVEDTYVTVDLTNKYGAYFTPKLVPNNSEIFTRFYLNGVFDITNRDSYDLTSESIGAVRENFGYDVLDFYIRYNEINRNIFFENKKFTSDDTVTIKYDSKYFDCYVVDSQFSNITVVNPNTNEETDLNFTLEEKLPSEDEEEEKGFFSRFDFFTKPVSFILDGVTMLYEEYLPPSVQNYFYISFGLVVIIIVIRIFF